MKEIENIEKEIERRQEWIQRKLNTDLQKLIEFWKKNYNAGYHLQQAEMDLCNSLKFATEAEM